METRALILVLVSAATHAGWNVLVKRDNDPAAFLLTMEAVTLVVLLPVLFIVVPFPEISFSVVALALASAFLHTAYAIWLARAYERADLTVVYPIVRSAPVLVSVLAWVALGEGLSPPGIAAIAMVSAGVWVLGVERPPRVETRSRGVHFALLALGATVAYSLVDDAGVGAMEPWPGGSPSAVAYMAILYPPYVATLAALVLRRKPARELVERMRSCLPSAVVAGLLGLVAYALVLEAFRTASVGYVVAARQASIPFAALIAVVVFNEQVSPRRTTGLAAITAGVVLLGLA